MCEPAVNDPYDELELAVTRFTARISDPLRTAAELADGLRRQQRLLDLLRLHFARDAATFAATAHFDLGGSDSPVGFLTTACHMAPGDAGAAICVGEQAAVLQRSVDAMHDGRIGYAHLALMSRTAAAVQESGAHLDEARLLRRAEEATPHQFRRDCAHARHAADAAAFHRRQQEAAEERFLDLHSLGGEDGGLWVKGFLDAVGAATLRAALEPLARRTGAGDHRPRDRRLADALLEMASYTLATGGQGATHCQVPHLQVTTTLETLAGAPHAPGGELEGCVPVSSATVQRLACSASVRRILLDPESLPVDVGRARRVPGTATRIRVEQRDRGCVWPRCTRAVRWTEVHHVVHWAHEGGATEEDNLVLLCFRHHDDVHLGGWRIVRVAGRREVLAIPPVPLGDPAIRGPATPDAA